MQAVGAGCSIRRDQRLARPFGTAGDNPEFALAQRRNRRGGQAIDRRQDRRVALQASDEFDDTWWSAFNLDS
jgi:hypothetical protein